MDNLVTKLRNLLQDNFKHRNYSRTFYSSKIFILEDANIDEDSLVIEKGGEIWEDDNYDYYLLTGKLIIHEITGYELEEGETLVFSYDCYEKYSNTELETFIKNAIYWLSVLNYKTFALGTGDVLDPEPTEVQENIIAIVGWVLCKGDIVSYRTPEFTVTFGNRLSLEDKIKKLIDDSDKCFGSLTYVDLSADAAEDN
jgi:hypothetical protein